jgi:radical SAM family uncharacterized protein
MSLLQDELDVILPHVQKPARYVGGELNAIIQSHEGKDISFALAFPDTYEIGMSCLAIHILYNLLNLREDTVCERVFAPWPDMEEAMRSHAIPLYTLETRVPVRDYDFFGFSLAYEMSYTTVLNMLNLAGMPLRSSERMVGDWPLVIAGGHCAFNPEPMAPFIDLFVIGEAEETLPLILDTWKSVRELSRMHILQKLSDIPGVYVPVIHWPDTSIPPAKRIKRQYVKDVDALPYPLNPIVPFIEVIHDRISLEVMRGCTRGCRFCQAGMITRPVREKSPEVLIQQAQELIASTGHQDISLVSLSTTDHSRVEQLVKWMMETCEDRKISVSLPSQRADVDCIRLLEEIQKVRRTGLTFAPEAGTQRMRDVINKNVTEENLFDAVEKAFDSGWKRIKLYFMIGLPYEEEEDILAIADLSTRVAKLARSKRVSGFSVTAAISAFVPKPHTPFQWMAQDSPELLERKIHLLRMNLKDKAVQLRWHDLRTIRIEAALSVGDRRVADVIEEAWKHGGKFDSWGEYFSMDRWLKAFQDCGLDIAAIANQPRPYEETLPWEIIDTGISHAWLRSESERAKNQLSTEDCHTGKCVWCQACDRFYTEKIQIG